MEMNRRMIKISKTEKDYLLSNGCEWYDDIHASTTRRHYYATASPKVQRLLDDYKKKTTVSRTEG